MLKKVFTFGEMYYKVVFGMYFALLSTYSYRTKNTFECIQNIEHKNLKVSRSIQKYSNISKRIGMYPKLSESIDLYLKVSKWSIHIQMYPKVLKCIFTIVLKKCIFSVQNVLQGCSIWDVFCA